MHATAAAGVVLVVPRDVRRVAATGLGGAVSPGPAFVGCGLRALKASRRPTAFTARSSSLIQASRFPTERTYVMVKPDGVQRGLVTDILGRFERKGYVLKGLKLFQCSKELAESHYKDLKEKPFFPDLVNYIISGPVVCTVWEGPGVILGARKVIGATSPAAAEPGTIRGDLAVEVGRNVVHGSDSPESAEREIGLWFKAGEVLSWSPAIMPWLRE